MGNTGHTAGNGSSQVGTIIEKRVENALDSSEHVATEIRDGLEHLGDVAKKTGTAAIQQVSDVAERAYTQALATGKKGAEKFEREIKQYPLTAVFIAFGAGALLGVLSRRS